MNMRVGLLNRAAYKQVATFIPATNIVVDFAVIHVTVRLYLSLNISRQIRQSAAD